MLVRVGSCLFTHTQTHLVVVFRRQLSKRLADLASILKSIESEAILHKGFSCGLEVRAALTPRVH